MLPAGIEPTPRASEARILSVELRERGRIVWVYKTFQQENRLLFPRAGYIGILPAMIQSPELDDSQLALQIAFRTAFVSAVLFILLSVVFRSYPDSAIKSALEVVMKCAAVAVALLVARKKIISVKNLPESSHFVFLSTVFFYGITTIFVYL